MRTREPRWSPSVAVPCVNHMDESGGEGKRERTSSRAEGTLGDLAQLLVDNPWMNQALQVAFGARERASQAGASAIRNLNLPTGNDVDRLTRRLRAVSERLETVEDTLDRVTRELAELRRERDSARPGPSSPS
jgi:hypothetical protein